MNDDPATAASRAHPFRDSHQDAVTARDIPDTPQTRAPAYRLAFIDEAFLTREELRPVRLQLELLMPQLMLDEAGIISTIVLFGGARIRAEATGNPHLDSLSHYYDEARRFAKLMTERSNGSKGRENVIVTGGGPGVMEAAKVSAAKSGLDEVFVGGGAEIYRAALPLADRLYLTEIHLKPEGDTLFPPFDRAAWHEVKREFHQKKEGESADYTITVLERKL